MIGLLFKVGLVTMQLIPISLFKILIHCLPDCSFSSLNEAVNTHALYIVRIDTLKSLAVDMVGL